METSTQDMPGRYPADLEAEQRNISNTTQNHSFKLDASRRHEHHQPLGGEHQFTRSQSQPLKNDGALSNQNQYAQISGFQKEYLRLTQEAQQFEGAVLKSERQLVQASGTSHHKMKMRKLNDISQVETHELQGTAESEQWLRELLNRKMNLEVENQQLCFKLAMKEADMRKKTEDIDYLDAELTRIRVSYTIKLEEDQERLSKHMQNGGWLPEDDTKLISHLKVLKGSMKSWAKSYSIQKVFCAELIHDLKGEALLKELGQVVIMENGQLPAELCNSPRIPGLLLNALLAHNIYVNIIGEPFFIFFRDGSTTDMQELASWREVYNDMVKVNSREAQYWRAGTLRLLYPSKLSHDAMEQELREKTNKRISDVANRHADMFMRSNAMLLLKKDTGEDTKCSKKLGAIFHQAAELSFKLWTRKNEIVIRTAPELYRDGFTADSMDQHPLAQKHEADEEIPKGAPIKVVVHPCLQASGNDDGQGYDDLRTWAKAVVWAIPSAKEPKSNPKQHDHIVTDLSTDELHGQERNL